MLFKGSAVALVTPMQKNGEIDFDKLNGLVEWHIESDTRAFIINGTTGESATLSWEEQCAVLEKVCAQVNKRIPVIAGTGSNSTQKAIYQTKMVEQFGVDGCLVVTPYYNRPTQKGLLQHFESIAKQSSLPILLYNVPSRTACDLLPETVACLSKLPNIVGIKEATSLIERVAQLKEKTNHEFLVLSGEDATALDFMLAGGDGVISVTANVAPNLMSKMCDCVRKGDIEQAKDIEGKLKALNEALFLEANPIPVKWLLNHMGKIDSGIRLPLTPLSEQYHQTICQAFDAVGV